GVAPKLPDDAAAAKAELVPATTVAGTAVRTRIDAGKMALALGKEPTTTGAAELGWQAYEKGDVETAAKHLAEAAKAPDARPWVAYVLGLSQFALRQYPEAAESWES